MNGFDSPKLLGKSFSIPNSKTVPTTNARQCAWCTCSEEDPIDKHDDWCDKKIVARIIDKGNKKLKKNTVPMLEKKIKTLMTQLGEYETTLRLIAAPKRPDGTFNRDRESCRALAANILKAYKASI